MQGCHAVLVGPMVLVARPGFCRANKRRSSGIVAPPAQTTQQPGFGLPRSLVLRDLPTGSKHIDIDN